MRAAHIEARSVFSGNDVLHPAANALRLVLLIGALVAAVLAWASTAAHADAGGDAPEAVAQLGD